MATIRQAAVAEDQAFVESDELRGLIAAGTERGYLTFEEIASTLEEVEVTKEQVAELHSHLVEQGVDVIARRRHGLQTSRPVPGRAGEPAYVGQRR